MVIFVQLGGCHQAYSLAASIVPTHLGRMLEFKGAGTKQTVKLP